MRRYVGSFVLIAYSVYGDGTSAYRDTKWQYFEVDADAYTEIGDYTFKRPATSRIAQPAAKTSTKVLQSQVPRRIPSTRLDEVSQRVDKMLDDSSKYFSKVSPESHPTAKDSTRFPAASSVPTSTGTRREYSRVQDPQLPRRTDASTKSEGQKKQVDKAIDNTSKYISKASTDSTKSAKNPMRLPRPPTIRTLTGTHGENSKVDPLQLPRKTVTFTKSEQLDKSIDKSSKYYSKTSTESNPSAKNSMRLPRPPSIPKSSGTSGTTTRIQSQVTRSIGIPDSLTKQTTKIESSKAIPALDAQQGWNRARITQEGKPEYRYERTDVISPATDKSTRGNPMVDSSKIQKFILQGNDLSSLRDSEDDSDDEDGFPQARTSEARSLKRNPQMNQIRFKSESGAKNLQEQTAAVEPSESDKATKVAHQAQVIDISSISARQLLKAIAKRMWRKAWNPFADEAANLVSKMVRRIGAAATLDFLKNIEFEIQYKYVTN